MEESAKSPPPSQDEEAATLRRLSNEVSPTPSDAFAVTIGSGPKTPSQGGVAPTVRGWNLPLVDRERYLLDGLVAEGGHGRILRAQDLHLERVVALKEPFSSGSSTEERFLREARITARLQHPSIVPVYEAGRWPGGEPFYAMKLLSGRSLARLIDSLQSLSERLAALPHVLAVAEAMAYAHSQRVIHRDLKPSNILVGEFGETVVVDWGLAKELDKPDLPPSATSSTPVGSPEPEHTQMGTILGTPAYMPPEQALGRPVDERADVYALGSILYHLLSGRAPYSESSSHEVLQRVISSQPAPLAQLQPRLTQDLLDIVSRAMARDPAQRYPSARELAEDLRRFLQGQLVGAHRYTRWERMLRFIRRHQVAMTVAAVSLLLLGAMVVVDHQRVVREKERAEQERDLAAQRQAEAEKAEREANDRADMLALLETRHQITRSPDLAFQVLDSLSESFTAWGQARILAADAAAQGRHFRLRAHKGPLNSLEFSPDGRLIATTGDDKAVRLWDPRTGKGDEVGTYSDEAWSVTFSPDGRYLASSGKDGLVMLRELASGISRDLKGHSQPVHCIMFSRDGRYLLSAGNDGKILRWEVASGTSLLLGSHAGGVLDFKWMRDGRHLATAGRKDKTVQIWDVESGSSQTLTVHSHIITALTSAPSGTLAAATGNGQILVWDSPQARMRVLNSGADSLLLLALSPDGRSLAAQGSTGPIRLWDMKQGGPPRVFESATNWKNALIFSADGQWLAAGGKDGKARLWEVASGRLRVLTGAMSPVASVDFSPDGQWLAVGNHDGSIRIYSKEERYPLTVTRHEEPLPTTAVSMDWRHLDPSELKGLLASVVSAVAFTPDGRHVLSAGQRDGMVRLSTLEGEPRAAVKAHPGAMTAAFALPEGRRMATAGQDGTVVLWDDQARRIQELRGPPQSLDVLSLSADGAWVAAGSAQGEVWLWSTASGQGRALGRHPKGIRGLAFSPEGRSLASGDSSGELWLWEVASGQGKRLHQHQAEAAAIAFSPDGRLLASGSADHTLWVYELSSGKSDKLDMSGLGLFLLSFSPDSQELFTVNQGDTSVLRTHALPLKDSSMLSSRAESDAVLHLAFSPDGRRAVTGHFDGTARIWDIRSGESRPLAGHQGPVIWVAFSPDGKQVLTASQDGTVRLWPDDLPEDPRELRAWIAEQARQ
jgi:WD40 repeat protein